MRYSIFFSLVLISSFSQAQQFAGLWEGTYITADTSYWNTIKLDIKYKGAGNYEIKSFTKDKTMNGADSFMVCKMDYKILPGNSIVLYERAVFDSAGINDDACLQTMKLQLFMKHRICELAGDWYCSDENDKRRGYIRLTGKVCVVF